MRCWNCRAALCIIVDNEPNVHEPSCMFGRLRKDVFAKDQWIRTARDFSIDSLDSLGRSRRKRNPTTSQMVSTCCRPKQARTVQSSARIHHRVVSTSISPCSFRRCSNHICLALFPKRFMFGAAAPSLEHMLKRRLVSLSTGQFRVRQGIA